MVNDKGQSDNNRKLYGGQPAVSAVEMTDALSSAC